MAVDEVGGMELGEPLPTSPGPTMPATADTDAPTQTAYELLSGVLGPAAPMVHGTRLQPVPRAENARREVSAAANTLNALAERIGSAPAGGSGPAARSQH